MTLRDYQREAIESIRKEWEAHIEKSNNHPRRMELKPGSSEKAVDAYTGTTIIDGPGSYVTRRGGLVDIEGVRGSRWAGAYATTGIRDYWLPTGRLFLWDETQNDIVGKYEIGD